MSNRKRVIYQCEAVFAGPTPATGAHIVSGVSQLKQFTRVQSASHSYNVTRKDVNQFGQLAAIQREITTAPTVNMSLSYFPTDGANEKILGFNISGNTSCLSGILNKVSDEKNYFFLTVGEGNDAVGDKSYNSWEVAGFGNAFLTDYSIEGQVGNFVTATISLDASQVVCDIGTRSGEIPAVDPSTGNPITGINYLIPDAIANHDVSEVSVLKPGDITLDIETPFGAQVQGAAQANIQSFRLQIPLTRQPLNRLGSKFAFSKEIQFPLTVTLNVTAELTNMKAGKLSDVLCNDIDYNLAITMRKSQCVGVGPVALKFDLRGFKIESQSYQSQIGQNKTVQITYAGQIGAANDITKGVFITGSQFTN